MPTPYEMRLASTDPEFRAELMATVRLKIERITQLRQHDPKSKALAFELCRLRTFRASLELMQGDACTALDEMLKG